jgi:hypothetical protein
VQFEAKSVSFELVLCKKRSRIELETVILVKGKKFVEARSFNSEEMRTSWATALSSFTTLLPYKGVRKTPQQDPHHLLPKI